MLQLGGDIIVLQQHITHIFVDMRFLMGLACTNLKQSSWLSQADDSRLLRSLVTSRSRVNQSGPARLRRTFR